MNALIAGAGYLWDEANQQVVVPGDPGGESCSGTYYESYGTWNAVGAGSSGYVVACDPASVYAIQKAAIPAYWQANYGRMVTSIDEAGSSTLGDPPYAWRFNVVVHSSDGHTDSFYFSVSKKSGDAVQPPLPAVPVTDEQLGQLIASQGSPDLWQWLLTDPTTGAPITTPSIKQQIWDIQKQQVQDAGGDPSTVTEPATSGDVSTLTSEDQKPSDWPDFCAWAKPVCDFFSHDEEPPLNDDEHPPLPVIDAQPQTWSSGLPSTATCPPPIVIELPAIFGSSLSISYQPFCDFALMIQPLVLAAAYLTAAFFLIRGV